MVVHCRDELAPKQLIQHFLPNGYRSTSASTNLFTHTLMFFMCRVNDTTNTPKLPHYLGTSERDVLPLEKKRTEDSWNCKEMTPVVVQIFKLEVDGRLSLWTTFGSTGSSWLLLSFPPFPYLLHSWSMSLSLLSSVQMAPVLSLSFS